MVTLSRLWSSFNSIRWEKVALAALVSAAVVFGGLVEMRSAFLKRRMTDLDVYLRAAWAVRAGENIYDVTDPNGWHYQYPPLFAILMTPFADPPDGVDRAGAVPFAVSVAFWYLFSVGCLVFSVHHLATALEESLGTKPVSPESNWRWWLWRLVPIWVCLVPIGHTLMRGQVNLLVLALLSALTAAIVRGQSARAGWWLAGAICLKVIPAFLLIVPVWRRDFRCLRNCALGLAIGLGAIPVAVFGYSRTVDYYRDYTAKLLLPGLGQGSDQSRAKELTEMTANDSQSLLAAFHNAANLDRATRPSHASAITQWVHKGTAVLLILVTLWSAGWRRRAPGPLFPSAMIVVMLLISPVSHLHYFCLCIPLVMAIMATTWKRTGSPRLGFGLIALFLANGVATAVPNFPGMELARDLGVAMYPALIMWIWACALLRKEERLDRVGLAGLTNPQGVAA